MQETQLILVLLVLQVLQVLQVHMEKEVLLPADLVQENLVLEPRNSPVSLFHGDLWLFYFASSCLEHDQI